MSDSQAPWEAFPDKKPVSLFWRMGTGEGFFHRWLEVIRAYDRPQLERYLDEHAAPPEWRKGKPPTVKPPTESNRLERGEIG